MPDWKNDKEYEFTTSLTPEGWAWEFLRRNQDYQKIFAYVRQLNASDLEKYGPLPKSAGLLSTDILHTRFYEPERLEGETARQWSNRVSQSGAIPQRYRPERWYAREWGLLFDLADPADDHPPRFAPYRPFPEVIRWDSLDDYFLGDDENYEQQPDRVVLGFDLDRPLTPQLDEANKILQASAEAYGVEDHTGTGEKVQKQKLRLYLRVLDAEAAGAANPEIVSVLLGNLPNDTASGYHANKTRSNLVKQAKRVCKKPWLCLTLEP